MRHCSEEPLRSPDTLAGVRTVLNIALYSTKEDISVFGCWHSPEMERCG